MKPIFKVLRAAMFMTAFAMALAPMVRADEKAPAPPPDNSSAELNRIKALEGRWSSTTSMFGKPDEKVYTEYEVTAGGSAVLERIFPGTPQEMISVYYDDDQGRLAMTHYCMMRNRPTLKLVKSEGDTLTMDVAKVEGLKSKDDPSMGGITLHFTDKDHFESTCQGRGKDAEKQPPTTMVFTRVRKR
ncbi:MAG TPA: hypothetical protein VLJ37_02995 [bacterium]|nr:hypothetical protein [bacterium]